MALRSPPFSNRSTRIAKAQLRSSWMGEAMSFCNSAKGRSRNLRETLRISGELTPMKMSPWPYCPFPVLKNHSNAFLRSAEA